MIEKSRKGRALPDTDPALRPASFPIGSPESRAAARALLVRRDEQRYQIRKTMRWIVSVVGGTDEPPRCERILSENGVLTEIVWWSNPETGAELDAFVERHPISMPWHGEGH